MAKYLPYLLAPLLYTVVAAAGRVFTAQGSAAWYPTIAKPSYTPPGVLIGIVWTVIYVLSAVSLILFIRAARERGGLWFGVALYFLNGVVNALWSYLFFTRHFLGLAVIDAGFIGLTVAGMMIVAWPRSRAASLLLLPYLLWVSFATFLSFAIYRLN